MDELNNSFGKLSMDAPVWVPGGGGGGSRSSSTTSNTAQQQQQQQQQQQHDSDLRASMVKEFVPGQAWGANNNNSNNNNNRSSLSTTQQLQHHMHHHQQQQQHDMDPHHLAALSEATISSGPIPSLAAQQQQQPHYRAIHTLGLEPDLWRHYRDLSFETTRQMDPTDALHKAVPLPYCAPYCLDNNNNNNSNKGEQDIVANKGGMRSSFGYPCTTFQVTSREDGLLYCIHRYDSVRGVSAKIAASITDRWTSASANGNTPNSGMKNSNNNNGDSSGNGKSVRDHPGVVAFHHCFCAQRAVFFVHDYIPGARTLHERFLLSNHPHSHHQHAPLLPAESILWSCISQLVSALRTIHGRGLAVRCLDPRHVLGVPDPSHTRLRVRINCLGVVDALEFEARKHVKELQQHDIRCLGKLVLSLASGTDLGGAAVMTNNNNHHYHDTIMQCEAFLAQNYSNELHNLTMTLLQAPRPPSIQDVSRVLCHHCYHEQDATYQALDRTEMALASEYESGRALRLLLKLGFVNERPEFGPNRRWSQSGDAYVLTLFRDYVFHQADGAGNPVMDLGHVVTALNKLDAASEEKIVLASRDGKSLMVVTYADIARCLESAFQELLNGSVPPTTVQY